MSGMVKAIVAAIGAVLVVIASALTDNQVNADEGIAIGTAVLNAFLVYISPNLSVSSAKFSKTIIAGGLAVLSALASYLVDGLSAADIINLVILFATAAGVLGLPNKPATKKAAPAS